LENSVKWSLHLSYGFTEHSFKVVFFNVSVGHEFAFVAFLLCLFKIGACDENDLMAVGCKVFPKYVFFMLLWP